MVEEEYRRRAGREEKRINGVKSEVCYGGLDTREVSNDRKEENEETKLTGWAVPTSFVR